MGWFGQGFVELVTVASFNHYKHDDKGIKETLASVLSIINCKQFF